MQRQAWRLSHVHREYLSIVISVVAGSVAVAGKIQTTSVAVYDDGPESVFCSYTCGAGRPSRPGSCFHADRVFDTGDINWLILRTRDETMLPGDRSILDEWKNMSTGNMTWEGWFRVTSPPPVSNTLFGTYGSNHDSTGGKIYIVSESRRRFAAVFLDNGGNLELSTNAGRSSGSSPGFLQVNDGRWHHVAAVFSDVGGAQINVTVRVKWVDVATINNRLELREPVFGALQEAFARVAGSGARKEDVIIRLENALFKPTPVFWEYAMRAYVLINSPLETVQPRMTELRASRRLALEVAAAVRSVELMTIATSPDYTVDDIVADPEDVTLPEVLPTGSATLWVDGYEASEAITYDLRGGPDDTEEFDNVGMDGQIVVGGGQLGRAIGAQVGQFRIWNVALSQVHLEGVRQCTLPDLSALIGGAPPHGLIGSYELRGTFKNAANVTTPPNVSTAAEVEILPLYIYSVDMELGPDPNPDVELGGEEGGAFVKGGVCSHNQCPSSSPGRGCPLGREVRFESQDSCEDFAAWNFCRKAGQSRGRPAMPEHQGCHAGGPITGRGGPFSWRVNRTTH